MKIGAKDPAESFSYPIVLALADQKEIFAGVTGFSGFTFNVGDPGSEARVPGAVVTGGYYETLGLTPVTGRLLMRDDHKPGAALVDVISYGYWERQFARSPEVVGRILLMNGAAVTIIGVSPRGFVGANVGSIPDRAQVQWLAVRESICLLLYGIVLGSPLYLPISRVIRAQVFQVQLADPISLASALLLLTLCGALATFVPSRRASKIDPMVALRYE